MKYLVPSGKNNQLPITIIMTQAAIDRGQAGMLILLGIF